MKNMTLPAIANACNGNLIHFSRGEKTEASGVVLDSRLSAEGTVFIAVKGERVDGHDFIDDVMDKGALGVVCEKAPLHPRGPYILVENSLQALKDIARWYRQQLHAKVVGITGSVGKTSTKELIAGVLSQKYHVLKTEGNFNNEVGLPLTVLKIREEHEFAVLEMGISQFGEMSRLSRIAKPDIGVITNIGQSHMENLKSRQGILKAKTELFDHLNPNGRVCLNGDDEMLSSIDEIHGKKPFTFGLKPHNDVYATAVKTFGIGESQCTVHACGKTFSIRVPLPGEHMIYNALAGISIGILMGMGFKEIASGLESVHPMTGRNHIIRHKKWTVIDDCYNANPVSMKAAIDLLSLSDTRRVAILGDMFELGTEENLLHFKTGTYAASQGIHVLVCVGKLSKNMYEGASKHFRGKRFYFETLDALMADLSSIVSEGDTILVKASHSMGFEKVVNALLD